MIETVGNNASVNPYGNIRRIGVASNGRVLYQVIDSEGKENGRLSVPKSESDTFESAYRDVMSTAPEIQKYAKEHSSEKEVKKRRGTLFAIVSACGAMGAAIPIALYKSQSTISKVLATVGGIIIGLSVGFVSSLALTSPPGTYKFAKATRTFSQLDIKQENAEREALQTDM